MTSSFKSGFVNIIGNPNVGKSTLLNALLGEPLSIISPKPQTTRHRIHGILTTDTHQIVFSDTPGFIDETSYRLHEKMNRYVHGSFTDADLMLFMTTPNEVYPEEQTLLRKLEKLTVPVFLVLNKVDQHSTDEILQALTAWQDRFSFAEFFPISALKSQNTDRLLEFIIARLPHGPKYYPDDQLSNRDMRFFVSEMIREQIFLNYREEIPYSTEVVVQQYKESPEITRIEAVIFVNRKTQVSILVGKGGQSIKTLGIAARKRIEEFTDQRIHLELFVKTRENWRDDEKHLNQLGYRK